jgi:hypothetical protein
VANPSEPQKKSEPLYPALEGFVEFATPEELASVFAPLKADLAQLKGSRAEPAKKAQGAVERTEELLQYLLQLREKLEVSRDGR